MKHQTKAVRIRFFRLTGFVLFCLFLLSLAHVSGQTAVLSIKEVLKNQENAEVVAVSLLGTFSKNDIVNLYTNEVFIKAKIIGETIQEGEILLENISTDVFVNGVNMITAKLERKGTLIGESQPYTLVVKNPPPTPDLAIVSDALKTQYTPRIAAPFKIGDILILSLNGKEVRTFTLATETEEPQRTVALAPIEKSQLIEGSNTFSAIIRRDGLESEAATALVIVAVEQKEVVDEIEDTEVEVVIPDPALCTEYVVKGTLTHPSSDAQQGFGSTVTLSESLLAVGTLQQGGMLYTNTKEGWREGREIAEGPLTNGKAGRTTLLFDGESILLGLPESNSQGTQSGGVTVFSTGTPAMPQFKIAPKTLETYDAFGLSLAASEQFLAVGIEGRRKNGGVYVYEKLATTLSQPALLSPTDNAEGQQFGKSLLVLGTTIVVGAPGTDVEGREAGAVYLYEPSKTAWDVEKLLPIDEYDGDRFGVVLAASATQIFVGAPGTNHHGMVYVFAKEGGRWVLAQRITPPVLRAKKEGLLRFGESVVYSADTLVIGAPGSGDLKNGEVHIYEKEDGEWSVVMTLPAVSREVGDRFGMAVAFDGAQLIVGAPGVDARHQNDGAVYLFSKTTAACETEEKEEVVEQKTAEELLEEKQTILSQLVQQFSSLLSFVTEDVEQTAGQIAQLDERVVIYNEEDASAGAQQRAAEMRGFIGPGIPASVIVTTVQSDGTIPQEDTLRSREVVVNETRESLGVVIPIETRRFEVGAVDEEIYRLQVFLNENGYRIADEGPGSPGNETNTFGESTEVALKSFQAVNGIIPTGALDNETRDVILLYVSSF